MDYQKPAITFGRTLRELRERSYLPRAGERLSLEKLAELIQAELPGENDYPSKATVSSWERDERLPRARPVWLALVKAFIHCETLPTPVQANAFLTVGNQAHLNPAEQKQLYPNAPHLVEPVAPPPSAPTESPADRPVRTPQSMLNQLGTLLRDLWATIPAADRASWPMLASYVLRKTTERITWHTGAVLLVGLLTYALLREFFAWPYASAQAALGACLLLAMGQLTLPGVLAAASRPVGITDAELATPETRQAERALRWIGAYIGYFITVWVTWYVALILYHLGWWPLNTWSWGAFALWWVATSVVTPRVMPAQFARGRKAVATDPLDFQIAALLLVASVFIIIGWYLMYAWFLSELGGVMLVMAGGFIIAERATSEWRALRRRNVVVFWVVAGVVLVGVAGGVAVLAPEAWLR